MIDHRQGFEALGADEQRILRVLSVICEPVNQTKLQQVLGTLRWTGRDGTSLSRLMAKPLRERLISAGLVEQQRDGLICAPELIEALTRESVADGTFDAIVKAAEKVIPVATRNAWVKPGEERRMRTLRIALYSGNEQEVVRQLKGSDQTALSQIRQAKVEPLSRVCFRCGDSEWLQGLDPRVKVLATAPLVREAALELTSTPDTYGIMEWLLSPLVDDLPDAADALAEQRLLRGQLAKVSPLLEGRAEPVSLSLQGWLQLALGEYTSAIVRFEASLSIQRKQTRKRNIYLPGIPGILHLLALLQRGQPADLELVQKKVQICLRADLTDLVEPAYRLIGELAMLLAGQRRLEDCVWLQPGLTMSGAFPILFQSLALGWLGKRPAAEVQHALADRAHQAADQGLGWYAHEATALLKAFDFGGKLPLLGAPPDGMVLMTGLLSAKPAWEIALNTLMGLSAATAGEAASGGSDRRMAWLLGVQGTHATLEPREQKRTKRGGWTGGRVVSLQKLADEPEQYPYLTPQDRQICSGIVREQETGWYGHYPRVSYWLDPDVALPAAVGHPLVLRHSAPDTPVELVSDKPVLSVVRRSRDMLVSIEPFPPEGRSLLPVEETPQRIRLIQFDAAHREVARVLGESGLRIPLSGKARLLQGLGALAPLLTVHSDIGGGENTAETVPADSRPHLHLSPLGDGLSVELHVHPLGDSGPQLHPAQGRATLFAERDGGTVRCTRNLDAERAAAAEVSASCPALGDNDGWTWGLEEPEMALSALEQLHALGDAVVLDWPRGRRIALSAEARIEQMRVAIKKQRDWLDLGGELKLDDGRVLAMRELLELVAASSGRFIRLGDDDFLVLSNNLRRRLDALRGLTDAGRFHPLAAPAIAEAIDGMSVGTSTVWSGLLKRLGEMRELEPDLPSTLQAQLRDYQLDGYRWLARLAHWGAGACLADDMGLGKTIQALALILSRTAKGPTLVLAPTSVCGNWIDEAERFAPTLHPLRFGHGDRAAMLQEAGPFDLVICSYGLLQSEGERLAEVEWETIVADEAQAFKNALTKRSRAVKRLRGGFRLITTGTPIENHLGELWNLFSFINPGLLGSLDAFNRRFAVPIEQDKDQVARQRLRQLLRPFILRRLKSEVLGELPPRTEITLQIELSDGEMALYEALRRQAVERLAEADSEANAGQQRIQLLAEIMRLRRVCCHPRLALPDSDLPGAKLDAFSGIVDELRDNRHKALVFSQFVDHLKIIRAHLDARGIRYQYLDGSTPEPKRRAAIQAFQGGDGELFLISLRAGGAGLNLTAADYVIHMDPWWNPAVEDQATGRAHRIGQQRPVTVYRLVAKDTIEERILALHGAKRALADDLLEGTGEGGRLSYEDMLALVS